MRRNLNRNLQAVGPVAVLLAVAMTSVAGGFWIRTYSPSAQVTASIPDAVVLVAAEGCHNAAAAKISATAEGLVNGKRQSVLLDLTPLSEGVYAVRRQWPGAGAWILAVKATHLGRSVGAVIEIDRNGAARLSAKPFEQSISTDEIEAALEKMAASPAKTTLVGRVEGWYQSLKTQVLTSLH
jgi:hypothetical protein